ncbi:hypothetical protein NDU88_000362 [Pleurodeles waltl]|uniref:Uncharacterized protein n=1 Tax=Pleurodeles waltl TaxID=8319 RepID=A0AAV7KMN6_PLEWA|nr:hypothetical protein NDU88_000362 [Pleurodeles waltl]
MSSLWSGRRRTAHRALSGYPRTGPQPPSWVHPRSRATCGSGPEITPNPKKLLQPEAVVIRNPPRKEGAGPVVRGQSGYSDPLLADRVPAGRWSPGVREVRTPSRPRSWSRRKVAAMGWFPTPWGRGSGPGGWSVLGYEAGATDPGAETFKYFLGLGAARDVPPSKE